MKENFKDGLNKVMLMNKAPVDSHYHQRGGDNRQVWRTCASVDNRQIRVWGPFGCLYSPVNGADWLDVLPVGGSRVGKDVWIGYIGEGFSQCQSPDAAPLTELRDLNTLLHIYSYCATRLYLIWTVSITVRISLGVEEVTRCCGDLSECRTMDGAALADNRSGITFTAELCMPWDAPEAVIDINSSDLVSLGSFPDHLSECRTMDGAALADDRLGITFTAELCMPWDAPEAVIDINSSDLVSLGSFPDKVGQFGRRRMRL